MANKANKTIKHPYKIEQGMEMGDIIDLELSREQYDTLGA